MSFSPEILEKKLGSLQETQDSIVGISQWVLFYHRHSDDTARIWADFFDKLPDNASAKRLYLLYLCNDVVQQARHKRKTQFITGFSKVLPEVLRKNFNKLDESIKPKVQRLVNVWSERNVFSSEEIQTMRKMIKESCGTSEEEKVSGEADGGVVQDLKIINTAKFQIFCPLCFDMLADLKLYFPIIYWLEHLFILLAPYVILTKYQYHVIILRIDL